MLDSNIQDDTSSRHLQPHHRLMRGSPSEANASRLHTPLQGVCERVCARVCGGDAGLQLSWLLHPCCRQPQQLNASDGLMSLFPPHRCQLGCRHRAPPSPPCPAEASHSPGSLSPPAPETSVPPPVHFGLRGEEGEMGYPTSP